MAQQIIMLSTDALRPHPRNEEFFSNAAGDDYERLKESIRDDGVLTPLRASSDMTIISGHQRHRACRELGITQIPVIIIEDLIEEDDKLRQLIAANFGRMKNDPIKQKNWLIEYERLRGVKRGRPSKSGHNVRITQEEIARELGVDERTIRRIKELDKLLPEIQDIVSEGRITPTTGFQLVSKLSIAEQEQLLSSLPAAQSFTQKQIQGYIDKLRSKDELIQELEQEKLDMTAEAAEAVRLINQSSDALEYVGLSDKLKSEQEKARKFFNEAQSYKEKLEATKDQLVAAKNGQSDELARAHKQIEALQAKVAKDAEAEQERIREAVAKALSETRVNESEEDIEAQTRYKFESNDDPKVLGPRFAREFQLHVGSFLSKLRSNTISYDILNHATPDQRRLIVEQLSDVVTHANQVIQLMMEGEKQCKIA